jgi:hypothetical protein
LEKTEREKIILVTMVGSVTSSSRKEVIADVAGLFSLNLGGRSAGLVPVDGCLGHATFISIVDDAQYFDTGEVPPSEFCSRSMPPQSQSPTRVRPKSVVRFPCFLVFFKRGIYAC